MCEVFITKRDYWKLESCLKFEELTWGKLQKFFYEEIGRTAFVNDRFLAYYGVLRGLLTSKLWTFPFFFEFINKLRNGNPESYHFA